MLADTQTATDADYRDIERVIAHEYFHNWTGNRVTCRDWFQLSLKEGLTVLRDQLYTSEQYGVPAQRIDDVIRLRTAQFVEDAGPLAHPVQPTEYIEINNFYTMTIYEKGAEIIRMARLMMGEERFRAGISLYLTRHDGEAATIEDFVLAMEEAGSLDLGQFRLWYAQAGTPRLRVRRDWDGASGTLTLTIGQHCLPSPGQPNKKPYHIPLALGLIQRDGSEVELGEQSIVSLRAEEAVFTFSCKPGNDAPIPSLLRGFSAPVLVDSDLTATERAFLMTRDGDPVARWDAGYGLATGVLTELYEALCDGRDAVAPPGLAEAWDAILHDLVLSPAVAAKMLVLPGLSEMFNRLTEVDPVALYRSRNTLRSALAHRCGTALRARYHGLTEALAGVTDAPGPSQVENMGKRALRNRCLVILSWLDEIESWQLIDTAFQQARSMTDTIPALACLVNGPDAAKGRALQKFAADWGDTPLVMDKFLACQAGGEGGE